MIIPFPVGWLQRRFDALLQAGMLRLNMAYLGAGLIVSLYSLTLFLAENLSIQLVKAGPKALFCLLFAICQWIRTV
jgi:hypothetical protein